MPQTLAVTALAAALYLLGGCGQTGPLYLPENAPAENESPDAAEERAGGSA
jgi:predicted small lipoprotein YifL